MGRYVMYLREDVFDNFWRLNDTNRIPIVIQYKHHNDALQASDGAGHFLYT